MTLPVNSNIIFYFFQKSVDKCPFFDYHKDTKSVMITDLSIASNLRVRNLLTFLADFLLTDPSISIVDGKNFSVSRQHVLNDKFYLRKGECYYE